MSSLRAYSEHIAVGLLDPRQLPATYSQAAVTLAVAPSLPDESFDRLGEANALAYARHSGWPDGHIGYLSCSNSFASLCSYSEKSTQDGWRGRRYWVVETCTEDLLGQFTVYHPPAAQLLPRAAQAIAVGYYLFPSHRRRGWAPQLISAGCQMLAASGIDIICAETNILNVPSSRSLQRAGFTPLGWGGPTVVGPGTLKDQATRRFAYSVDPARKFNWPYCPRPGGYYLGYTP